MEISLAVLENTYISHISIFKFLDSGVTYLTPYDQIVAKRFYREGATVFSKLKKNFFDR